MQLELARYIVDTALSTGNYDEDEVRIYENYQGRGMFGKDTTGIVGLTGTEIACTVLQYAQDCDLSDELCDMTIPTRFQQDSLGMSTIIY